KTVLTDIPPGDGGAISVTPPAGCSSLRRLPKASSRWQRSSTLSVGQQARSGAGMDVGRSGGDRQLRRGCASLILRRRAAAGLVKHNGYAEQHMSTTTGIVRIEGR